MIKVSKDSDGLKSRRRNEAVGMSLAIAMQEKGVRQSELAKVLGVDQPVISKMIYGKRHITDDEIAKINEYLDARIDAPSDDDRANETPIQLKDNADVEHYWTFDRPSVFSTNIRQMLLKARVQKTNEDDEQQSKSHHQEYYDSSLSSFGYSPKIRHGIPEVDVIAGAGEGKEGEIVQVRVGDEFYSGHAVVDEWKVPDNYMAHVLNVDYRSTLVMQIVGDSMSPTFHPGDRVLVDTKHNHFGIDGIYVISDGDSPPQIKRLVKIWKSEPISVEIVSDNPVHKAQTVQLSELHIIGRVAGRVSAT